MSKEYSKAFYNSEEWKECRKAFISNRMLIDGGMCQECREVPGYIVHHKKAITQSNINNPEITLSWSNLEYVCKECHDKFEGHGVHYRKKSAAGLLFKFDEQGQPISLREIDKSDPSLNFI